MTTTDYDANNQTTAESNELEEEGSDTHRVRYEYNSRGFVTKRTNEDGTSVSYEYDQSGNVTKYTDEKGYSYTYTYDKNNLPLTETDPMDGTTTYTYTPAGEVSSVTDAMGGQIQYTYDENGNLTGIQNPDGGVTKYEYDANGNKTFKEYPNYETAYYFYDECDRVIEMDEYNLNGKKLYKTTYSWDAEGNLLSEMQYNHGQSGSSASSTAALSVEDPGSSLASVLELSTLATVEPVLQEGINDILKNVEEIAGGSEADLPELQIPDTFTEAMEEKTGVDLDLDAADPAAEVPAAEAEAPSVEAEPETTDDSEDAEEEDENNPEGFE